MSKEQKLRRSVRGTENELAQLIRRRDTFEKGSTPWMHVDRAIKEKQSELARWRAR